MDIDVESQVAAEGRYMNSNPLEEEFWSYPHVVGYFVKTLDDQ